MRRIVFTALAICAVHLVFAQDTTIVKRKAPVTATSGYDHLMLQLGLTNWQGKPDSIHTKGISRTFNAYLMFAFPFKTSPHLSVAVGAGIASDNVFFDKTEAHIADPTATLAFKNVADTNHFKKYKIATAYLEAPVELRYTSNPGDDKHSFKVALGAKVGTMLSAWDKGKTLENRAGTTLKSYTEKEKSKRFFNTNRLSVMGRIGYGKFSLFTSYAVSTLFKEGVAPSVHPMTIGITLSGL
ncbi:MAG: outer membrane beta-barrel protein [Flavisolibacter sp.]